MTARADFTPDEWKVVLEGPPSAGMLVITAERRGMLRETFEMAKVWVEARQQHGHSELLDEIVAEKPALDHTRYGSFTELKEQCRAHLRDAVALLEAKATAEELDEYRQFTLNLAERVASAHKEHRGEDGAVTNLERAAITAVSIALGVTADA